MVGLCLLSIYILSTFTVTQRLTTPSLNQIDLKTMRSKQFLSLGTSRNLLNSSSINIDHPPQPLRFGEEGKFKRESIQSVISQHSTLNISEFAVDLAKLEESTNATHVNNLKQSLLNHSRVYRPGTWDGAGIVIEEYKLVLFTQGKVSTPICIWLSVLEL
jgi:hypothetical protein